jgi:clan AA aspartic protease
MGLVYATLQLRNPTRPELGPVEVQALADTGALHLCVPQYVATELGLEELEQREITFADGRKSIVAYAGPVEVMFQNRRCFVGAMVVGDEALLGAIPMKDLDLVVQPATRMVTVNPASPTIPSSVAKLQTVSA